MIFGKMGTLGSSQPSFVRFGLTLIECLCWFLLLIGADSQKIHPREEKALRAVKKSLTDPNQNLGSWNRGDPCIYWFGIFCYNTTLDDGYRHVQEMSLMNMNLSGSLSPELVHLSYMEIMNFMWNNISGTIPKEIGNITSLKLLLLNGNKLTGSLPDEIGYLHNLDRLQIDENQISGSIPKTLANLNKATHFHMNNNSLSGQIPPELSRLQCLLHLLLDNNNLSGHLPPELAKMPNLTILQLDNNNFEGSPIPLSYGNMSCLSKLSLRNCSLQGPIPNWSNMTNIAVIDLSLNRLSGTIPAGVLFENMTTIDLSNNNLNGTIPASFSSLPLLQKLSLANNSLSGSVPSTIWQNLNQSESHILDFRNNMLSNINGSLVLPLNVTVSFQGNPMCTSGNLFQFCGSYEEGFSEMFNLTSSNACLPQSCPPPNEYAPASPVVRCFCAVPLLVGYRLKSPGFTFFSPYADKFEYYISSHLGLNNYQLDIDSVAWQKGPRLSMDLKIFPAYMNNSINLFNKSEVLRIRELFSGWKIHGDTEFGPFELIYFTLLKPYKDEFPSYSPSGINKGALAGIILGTAAGSVTLSSVVFLLFYRSRMKRHRADSKRRPSSRVSIRIDGVKDFTYGEMAVATNNFNCSSIVGQGGYGKVYKGILADGTVVAIKRAQEGSLQGEKEFLTEIELLSRVHHRNLVSLVGYCDEEGEQMLIYEFMSNGTLRDHLSGKVPLTFAMRLRIALSSAKGILYLHMEANPPIYHRDIKASNILLDSRFTAKVADFGLSRLAPVPDLEGFVPAHVSTVVKGTPGYLDPEYFLTHKLTDKSDVYSLGVVFLELLTGMHPIQHGKNIVREVNIANSSGKIFSIIDEKMGSYPSECAVKFIKLALNCCHDDTDTRPSMLEVVRELESMWLDMPESDTKLSESIVSDTEKIFTPTSSSSTLKTSYVLQDISGSDLASGVIHTVMPR